MFALPAILFSKLSLFNAATTTVAGNESKSNCNHNRASNIKSCNKNKYSRDGKGYGAGNVEENCNKKQFVLLFIISIKLSRHTFVCVWESWRKCASECACKQCGMQREQVLAKGTERVKV